MKSRCSLVNCLFGTVCLDGDDVDAKKEGGEISSYASGGVLSMVMDNLGESNIDSSPSVAGMLTTDCGVLAVVKDVLGARFDAKSSASRSDGEEDPISGSPTADGVIPGGVLKNCRLAESALALIGGDWI